MSDSCTNHVGLTQHAPQSLATERAGMAGFVGAGLQTPGGAREEHREPRLWLGGSATPSLGAALSGCPSSSRCCLPPRPSASRPAAPRRMPCQRRRTTSSPTPSASASPTLDASDAAVIAAYDAYWSAVNQAAAATSGTGAWNTPALSATMVNPLLQQWQSELMQEEAQGIMVTGTFTPAAPGRRLRHRDHGHGLRLRLGHHR